MLEGLLFGLGFWSAAWIMIGFLVIGFIVDAFEDMIFGAFIAFAIWSGIALFVFHVNMFSLFLYEPLYVLAGIILYIATGGGYAGFWRFPNRISGMKDRVQSQYSSFLKDKDLSDTTENRKLYASKPSYNPTHPSHHVADLIAWVLFWPFGMAAELTHKPIRFIWNHGYSMFGNWFDSISVRFVNKFLG